MTEIPWGESTLEIPLPPTWKKIGIFQPPPLPSLSNPEEACREALRSPLGTSPLFSRNLQGKRVLLVCDDHSRPTPIASFLPVILQELFQAGVAKEGISILFALGVHRPMTEAEAEKKLGPAAHRFPWKNHDAFAQEGFFDLGHTRRGTPVRIHREVVESDLVLLLGMMEPHPLCGFSGGAKMILPGCAAATTIGANHLLATAVSLKHDGGGEERYPMREDLEEAVEPLRPRLFAVNVLLAEDGKVHRFLCGDPHAVVETGRSLLRSYAVTLSESVDVVLVGSHPFDSDLRQGWKCLVNVRAAARPQGALIGCLRCREGVGDLPLRRQPLPLPLFRWFLRLLGPQGVNLLIRLAKRHDPIEERFLAHVAVSLHRHHPLFLYAPTLPPSVGRYLGVRHFRDWSPLWHAVECTVRLRPTVAIFPRGGSTWVRLESGR